MEITHKKEPSIISNPDLLEELTVVAKTRRTKEAEKEAQERAAKGIKDPLDLTLLGYESVSHRSTDLVVWTKTDLKRVMGIVDVVLTMNEQASTKTICINY